MAIPSIVVAQRDFTAGQIDETAERREDTRIFRAGMLKLRNARILNAGPFTRRPGRDWIYKAEANSLVELLRPVPNEWWWVEFFSGSIRFRRRSPAATAPQTIIGLPWSASILADIRWSMAGSTLIVVHQSFRPWLFVYDPIAANWTGGEFLFSVDPNGESRTAFRNFFAGNGTLMAPSARTGSITLSFSSAVLNAGHVGVKFRYAEQQVTITSVSSSTSATATVSTQLPPTYDVTFDTVEGLQVGQVIEGVDGNARGYVTAINVGTKVATVVVTRNWTGYKAAEIVAGPKWKGTVSSQVMSASLGSLLTWDEEFCSNYRGWPGSVTVDQQRVIFSRFKQYGPAILWSAIGTLNDFKVGANPEEAIFEFVPNSSSVVEVLGGADEFVLTDTGIFYIPISSASPLQPGSNEFRLISQDGASTIRPVMTADGFVFINASRSRVIAVQATGQAARPYIADDATQFHSDLIKKPVCMSVTSSDENSPERYLYIVNEDGTLAVGRYQRRISEDGWIGWVPWDGAGLVKWVTAGGPDVSVTCEYETDGGLVRSVEVFNNDRLLDGCISISNTFNPTLENWLTGTEVSLVSNGWYRGEIYAPLTGTIENQIPVLPLGTVLGKNFVVEAEPFVPHAEAGSDQMQRLRRRRIKRCMVRAIRAQALEVAGRAWPFWRGGENQEVQSPIRDESYSGRTTGRDHEPRWSLKQELPGALTVLEMTTEVTI